MWHKWRKVTQDCKFCRGKNSRAFGTHHEDLRDTAGSYFSKNDSYQYPANLQKSQIYCGFQGVHPLGGVLDGAPKELCVLRIRFLCIEENASSHETIFLCVWLCHSTEKPCVWLCHSRVQKKSASLLETRLRFKKLSAFRSQVQCSS